MSTDARTLNSYDDGDPVPMDLADELDMAERVLDETASADIHNEHDMIRSSVVLRMRLRGLAAAVTASRGEGK